MSKHTPLTLTYINRVDIKNKKAGLLEPSGMAISHQTQTLWTVSDDTKRIFRLSLAGTLLHDDSFPIPVSGLEGIALDPSGEFLLGVKEETNEIVKIRIDREAVVERVPLPEMANYSSIASLFADEADSNKGLEGITWSETSETFFVLKEGYPGLLIEVAADLQTIISHTVLNDRNGFVDPRLSSNDIDFSGICHDRTRNCFWITSDRAKRLFLFDLNQNSVLQSFPLTYQSKGKQRQIKKAEGVAFDPATNRLYIASDRQAMLYVFEVSEN